MLPLAFFLLTLAGPLAYVGLMDQPLIRSTAWPTYLIMSVGVIGGLVAARRRRTTGSRIGAALSALFLALFVYFFVFWARLPDSDAFVALKSMPAFTLQDQVGAPRSLESALSAGPLLLVFYRGHW